jgi:hypothetical protein
VASANSQGGSDRPPDVGGIAAVAQIVRAVRHFCPPVAIAPSMAFITGIVRITGGPDGRASSSQRSDPLINAMPLPGDVGCRAVYRLKQRRMDRVG